MRFNKVAKCLLGITPIVVLPITFTSCSVYSDMLGGYTPSYGKLAKQTLAPEDAANKFFEKARTEKDFGLQENLWTHGRSAQDKDSGYTSEVENLWYESEFVKYYIYYDYINIDPDSHKISYKITTDIEEDTKYTYYDESHTPLWHSTGALHYKVTWECKNLVFDAMIYEEQVSSTEKRKSWLIKPEIYDGDESWTRVLKDDEEISFNVRYIIEAYNYEGIQRYAYEASETAVMDKTRSFESELQYLLDYFCCFYSYYLDDCIDRE